MKIIVLRGESHKGKSTTINFVYEQLKSKGFEIVNRQKVEGASENDFQTVLVCEINGVKKIIAINSVGDDIDPIQNAIIEYQKCDVLIQARNETVEIKDNTKFNNDTLEIFNSSQRIEVYKTVVNDKDIVACAIANYKDCATICSLI